MNYRLGRYSALVLIAVLVLASSGCATGRYTNPASSTSYAPEPDKALVVFMRNSVFGGAITSSLFEINDRSEDLIAIIGPNEKIAHYTDAGTKQFMVVSESADIMDAELLAGKIYYVDVVPRFGLWRARFSLRPFQKSAEDSKYALGSDTLKRALAGTSYVAKDPSADTWVTNNFTSIQSKMFVAMNDWSEMQIEEKQSLTLHPDDGLDSPILPE